MKNYDVKDSHDIQLKIQQLREGSGYVRKLLLAICGTCIASLLTILRVHPSFYYFKTNK